MACITYSVTTPESAEQGDHAEHGWWMPGGWEHPLADTKGQNPETLAEAKAGAFKLAIKSAVKHALELGCVEGAVKHDGVTVSSVDPACDRAHFERGEDRHYTLHVDGLTPLRVMWIKNYLQTKGVSFQ